MVRRLLFPPRRDFPKEHIRWRSPVAPKEVGHSEKFVQCRLLYPIHAQPIRSSSATPQRPHPSPNPAVPLRRPPAAPLLYTSQP
jgi:hypothetical protein